MLIFIYKVDEKCRFLTWAIGAASMSRQATPTCSRGRGGGSSGGVAAAVVQQQQQAATVGAHPASQPVADHSRPQDNPVDSRHYELATPGLARQQLLLAA